MKNQLIKPGLAEDAIQLRLASPISIYNGQSSLSHVPVHHDDSKNGQSSQNSCEVLCKLLLSERSTRRVRIIEYTTTVLKIILYGEPDCSKLGVNASDIHCGVPCFFFFLERGISFNAMRYDKPEEDKSRYKNTFFASRF